MDSVLKNNVDRINRILSIILYFSHFPDESVKTKSA
jgi:hypothetical protein